MFDVELLKFFGYVGYVHVGYVGMDILESQSYPYLHYMYMRGQVKLHLGMLTFYISVLL